MDIIANKNAEIEVKDAKIVSVKAMFNAKSKQLESKTQLLTAKCSEIEERDRGLASLQQKCGSLQTQLEIVQWKSSSLEVSDLRYHDL